MNDVNCDDYISNDFSFTFLDDNWFNGLNNMGFDNNDCFRFDLSDFFSKGDSSFDSSFKGSFFDLFSDFSHCSSHILCCERF